MLSFASSFVGQRAEKISADRPVASLEAGFVGQLWFRERPAQACTQADGRQNIQKPRPFFVFQFAWNLLAGLHHTRRLG